MARFPSCLAVVRQRRGRGARVTGLAQCGRVKFKSALNCRDHAASKFLGVLRLDQG